MTGLDPEVLAARRAVMRSGPDILDPATYDGQLLLSYELDRKRLVISRADPRVRITDEWLYRVLHQIPDYVTFDGHLLKVTDNTGSGAVYRLDHHCGQRRLRLMAWPD